MEKLKTDDTLSYIEKYLGKRISELRSAKGITLDELSRHVGFTKGYLSKIENSKAIPPLGTLIRIAQALDIEVADLLDDEAANGQSDNICIVRSWEQEPAVHGSDAFGYDYIPLANKRHHKRMEPFIMVFTESVSQDAALQHLGEEFMYVLSGEIAFEVERDGKTKTWVLSPKDSIYFDSRLPHRVRSVKGEASALIVIHRDEAPLA